MVLSDEPRSLLFGEKLQITPVINTSIPETDLGYDWEFFTDTLDTWWKQYVSVSQERELNYLCEMGQVLPEDGVYKLRLNVTQISSGRHFYSNEVEVSLATQPSVLGAMVFHGDGNSSDIGIVSTREFQTKVPADAFAERVLPHYYSEQNGGEKLAGKGTRIIQSYLSTFSFYTDNIVIIALTDNSSAVMESKTMRKNGDWNDLFAGDLNRGVPQNFDIERNIFVFDDGDIFSRGSFDMKFSTPLYEKGTSGYDFYPQIFFPQGAFKNKGIFFDRNSRAFVMSASIYNNLNPLTIMDARVAGGTVSFPFNPGDMRADLVYMDAGGHNGMLAVMKEDNGDYFLAEMDWTSSDLSRFPAYRYSLTHLPDVQNEKVIAWAFGTSYINMGYYATANGVWNFSVDAGQTIVPEVLKMVNNDPVMFEGEITMMKILKPKTAGGYYLSNVEMVVGTYGGTAGSGKLYSLELDPTSGRVKSVKNYSGFDRIYEVELKVY